MPNDNVETTKAQMRKGLLQFCIMAIIAEQKAYASDILLRLKEADLIVVEGTIYPLLSRLKSDGLLSYSWEESKSGPPRKYYELTESGRETLKQLRSTWQELSQSINKLIN